MNNNKPFSSLPFIAVLAVIVILGAFGCRKAPANRVQGYIEGEFVYVASPYGGALQKLNVERGQQVAKGDALFALESVAETAARDEAQRRLAQARANLADAQKGKRPTEIASVEAQLQQARASLDFSSKELARQERLFHTGAAAAEDVDRARVTKDENEKRVAQLEADLKTARLGSREDQIAAAEAVVRAQEAALSKAEWDLAQKRQTAPQAAVVFDTLYREGEWVAAGRPVVSLLPPQNIKVRAFIPEEQIGKVRYGDALLVRVDGVAEPFKAKVNFISPRAEYTPPVIFSQESRSKLVFMIEGVFDANDASKLHPGQPVDVQFQF